MRVSEVVPGEATRCFACGPTSAEREREDLWAYKHRHPNHHDGFVRFYCDEHVPAVKVAEPAPATRPTRRPRAATVATTEKAPPRRTPTIDAPVRAMCPNCFVEVSARGECGICGTTVA